MRSSFQTWVIISQIAHLINSLDATPLQLRSSANIPSYRQSNTWSKWRTSIHQYLAHSPLSRDSALCISPRVTSSLVYYNRHQYMYMQENTCCIFITRYTSCILYESAHGHRLRGLKSGRESRTLIGTLHSHLSSMPIAIKCWITGFSMR